MISKYKRYSLSQFYVDIGSCSGDVSSLVGSSRPRRLRGTPHPGSLGLFSAIFHLIYSSVSRHYSRLYFLISVSFHRTYMRSFEINTNLHFRGTSLGCIPVIWLMRAEKSAYRAPVCLFYSPLNPLRMRHL